MIYTKTCRHCGREFKSEYEVSVYCDRVCRSRSQSAKRYEKMKDDPEYKRKSYENTKRWINANRAHFNDLCREKNKVRMSDIRAERKRRGLCYRCGGKKDTYKSYCSICEEKIKMWKKARRQNETRE